MVGIQSTGLWHWRRGSCILNPFPPSSCFLQLVFVSYICVLPVTSPRHHYEGVATVSGTVNKRFQAIRHFKSSNWRSRSKQRIPYRDKLSKHARTVIWLNFHLLTASINMTWPQKVGVLPPYCCHSNCLATTYNTNISLLASTPNFSSEYLAISSCKCCFSCWCCSCYLFLVYIHIIPSHTHTHTHTHTPLSDTKSYGIMCPYSLHLDIKVLTTRKQSRTTH